MLRSALSDLGLQCVQMFQKRDSHNKEFNAVNFTLDTVRPICVDTPNALLPNPDHCAQYYDCQAESTTLGHFMKDCSYPQLFDEEHRQCRNYRDVECGTRYEPKSPCEYYGIVTLTFLCVRIKPIGTL